MEPFLGPQGLASSTHKAYTLAAVARFLTGGPLAL